MNAGGRASSSETGGNNEPIAGSEAPLLLRSLSLTHAVLYGLGVTIGAGIYVLIGVAAGRSGMHAPLAFLVAAITMAFTAASFAELGTRMPVNASEAAYVRAAFDRRWLSIAMGLLVILTATISGATISAGSAGYIQVFFDLPTIWIIAGVVLTMGAVAGLATTQSVTFAGALTLIEIGGLVLIIGAGMSNGNVLVTRIPELFPALDDLATWTAIGGTSIIAVFAFIGFEHLVNVAEELKNPNRTLPRALFLTLGITAVLYMLVVWVAVTTVPPEELARSPAPLATVFRQLTGLPLVTMSAIAVVATLNGVVVHMIMISRVLHGLASRGDLPRQLARLNRVTHTPLVATAMAVTAILVLAVAVPLDGLASWASRGTLLIFAGINLALIAIKRREPTPEGAFRCPVVLAWLGLVSSVALLALDVIA
jgi:amino acid transporter